MNVTVTVGGAITGIGQLAGPDLIAHKLTRRARHIDYKQTPLIRSCSSCHWSGVVHSVQGRIVVVPVSFQVTLTHSCALHSLTRDTRSTLQYVGLHQPTLMVPDTTNDRRQQRPSTATTGSDKGPANTTNK